MTQTQNDLLEVTQRNIYIQEDLQIPVPQIYINKRQLNLRDSPIMSNDAYSFVVDWQITTCDYPDINKCSW